MKNVLILISFILLHQTIQSTPNLWSVSPPTNTYSSLQLDPQSDFLSKLEAHRKKQHQHFKSKKHTPFKNEADRLAYKGLEYYPPNEAYRVPATFKPAAAPDTLKIPTSSQRIKTFIVYGTLHFNLQGQALSLQVYQNIKLMAEKKYKHHLFIPFTDHTNGETTYGGGRYIDLEGPWEKDQSVTLDFNYCYNPYCAYSDGWNCPIPPQANALPIPIEAGVKAYKAH